MSVLLVYYRGNSEANTNLPPMKKLLAELKDKFPRLLEGLFVCLFACLFVGWLVCCLLVVSCYLLGLLLYKFTADEKNC